MASGIDSTTSAALLTALHGGTAVTFGTSVKLKFNSTQRATDSGTDTEFTASGGYAAGGATITYAAAAAGAPSTQAISASAVTITNAPAGNWAGCTEVDNLGKNLFWATLTGGTKVVNAGDTVTVPGTTGLSDSLG